MIEHNLHGLADVALTMTRALLLATGSAGKVFLLGYPDGTVSQLKLNEEQIAILNSGAAKKIAFKAVRRRMEETGATCMVFAGEAWRGHITDKARELPKGRLAKLLKGKSFDELEQQGLITREECLASTAQSEHQMVGLSQPFRRGDDGGYEFGAVETATGQQKDFNGRIKVFG